MQLFWTFTLTLGFSLFLFTPTRAGNPTAKADKLFEKGHYGAAAEKYRDALGKDSLPEALLGLAKTELKLRHYAEAQGLYRLAEERAILQPADLPFYAQAEIHAGNYGTAERLIKLYQKHNADDPAGDRILTTAQMAPRMLSETVRYRVEPLIELNTLHDEFAPSQHGTAGLGFVTRRAVGPAEDDVNPETGRFFADPYSALAAGEKNFGVPDLLPPPIADEWEELGYTLSADGKWLVFARRVKAAGLGYETPTGFVTKLYASEKDGVSWGRPKLLPFQDDSHDYTEPSFGLDGRKLVFASNRPGGQGGYDLWETRLEVDTWVKPSALEETINSPGDERFPFAGLSDALVFASDGHPGLGGLDMFRAAFDGQFYDVPVHLGPELNSSYNEMGLVLNAEQTSGILASDRPSGAGGADLYFVYSVAHSPTPVQAKPLVVAEPPTPEPEPEEEDDDQAQEEAAIYVEPGKPTPIYIGGASKPKPEPEAVEKAEPKPSAAASLPKPVVAEAPKTTPSPEPKPIEKPAVTPVDKPALAQTKAGPAPSRVEKTSPTSGPVYHQVELGENLYRLALKYNTTVEAIKALNGLDSDLIFWEQRLRVR